MNEEPYLHNKKITALFFFKIAHYSNGWSKAKMQHNMDKELFSFFYILGIRTKYPESSVYKTDGKSMNSMRWKLTQISHPTKETHTL